jgi:nitroreductase
MTNLIEAIETRRSRRKYLPIALDPASAKTLQELINNITGREPLKMQLFIDDGNAFDGFKKSYGMFSGVRNYIVLIGDSTDALSMEKFGYYGEQLVLQATALGLGTCWVGGTFDRKACPVKLDANESIVCAITVGAISPELSKKEKLIRWATHRKTKTAEQLYTSDGSVPDWFLAGIKAVQKAPSAVNRQPVIFAYDADIAGTVTASVQDITVEGIAFDLGIAKLHFEIGAGGGEWDFGNGGKFMVHE